MNAQTRLTFEELAELRVKTERVSKFLQERLAANLDTLRPLLAPERLLGKYAGGKTDVPRMDHALNQLRNGYKDFSTKPYELPLEFDPQWLTLTGTRLELYPWEYVTEAKTDRETKAITVTSPVRWVANYNSGYTLAQLRQALRGKEARRPEYVRQFVINALILHLMISTHPEIVLLFGDLRYELKVEYMSELGKLPLVTMASCLTSFCPLDDLVLTATSFSGIPAFVELIDTDAVHELQDLLKIRIEELLK